MSVVSVFMRFHISSGQTLQMLSGDRVLISIFSLYHIMLPCFSCMYILFTDQQIYMFFATFTIIDLPVFSYVYNSTYYNFVHFLPKAVSCVMLFSAAVH